MLRRRDRGEVTSFTRVVIETSGLADPAPILHTLMTDAATAGRLTLSAVVTTVDAVTGASTLAREQVSVKQVALADHLIVTKSDLAPAVQVLDRLAALNSSAPVALAQHGRIDSRLLDRAVELHQSRDDVHEVVHTHDADIQTYAIVRTDPIRAVALTLFLETLAEHCGADLLRLKGIVNIRESPDRPGVIHGVQHVFHPLTWLACWPSDDRRSRMVFITRRIPQRWLEVLIDALDAEVAMIS